MATAAELPFIVSTDLGQVNPETRKRIRRHVMIGKNRDRLITRKSKPAKAPPAIPRKRANLRLHKDEPQHPAATWACIPRKVGSEQSLLRFAGGVDAAAVAVIFNFSAIAKRTLFPLEPYLSFASDKTRYIEPLAYDELYLHTMIFTTKTYFDLLEGRSARANASPHFHKSLRLLRQRLEYPDRVTSALTIYVIFAMAMHAFIMGDMEAVRSHMRGVQRIIHLRGGIWTLAERHSKLLVELLRGSNQYFIPTHRQLHASHDLPLSQEGVDGLDSRLQMAWGVLKQFSARITIAANTHTRITKEAMLEVMATVMYDLIDEPYASGSIDEAVRLGILVFAAGTFLPWRAFSLSCVQLEMEYRRCLSHLTNAPPRLWAWLLMTGLVSMNGLYQPHLDMLQQKANELGIRSWPEMRSILDDFLWIGALGDNKGEEIFTSLNR